MVPDVKHAKMFASAPPTGLYSTVAPLTHSYAIQ